MDDVKKLSPDFIIIGAMKSATSTLHEQLDAQPGIFMSMPKEPNFFSDDDQYLKGGGWYTSLFKAASAGEITGESSTHYTKLPTYPNTIQRMSDFGLDKLKLIYIVRHPIDRLVSHYMHEWSQGNISCGINEAIDQYPELIEYSLYSKQLSPYIERFGSEKIKVVFFSQLKASPEVELRKVCEFIGYQSEPAWSEGIGKKNSSSERVRKFPFYDVLVESNVMISIRRVLVPKLIRNTIRQMFTLSKRPEINNKNIKRLEKLFNADLIPFSKMIGVQGICCNNFDDIKRVES